MKKSSAACRLMPELLGSLTRATGTASGAAVSRGGRDRDGVRLGARAGLLSFAFKRRADRSAAADFGLAKGA